MAAKAKHLNPDMLSQLKQSRSWSATCPYCGEVSPRSIYSDKVEGYKTKQGAMEWLEYHSSQCSANPKQKKCATCKIFVNSPKLKSGRAINRHWEDKDSGYILCPKLDALVAEDDCCNEYQ